MTPRPSHGIGGLDIFIMLLSSHLWDRTSASRRHLQGRLYPQSVLATGRTQYTYGVRHGGEQIITRMNNRTEKRGGGSNV